MKPTPSLEEVHQSIDTGKHRTGVKRLLSFMGPAYLVSVGYMDPGNWASDIAGGSQFGYQLLWVLVMSNLIAILMQSMCARLGLVRRMDLAQASRQTYPRFVNGVLYVLAELAIAATDLAEVLGMAIGIQLLFGLPLVWGVVITLIDTVVLMFVMRGNIRRLEAIVLGLITIIGSAFLVQVILAQPSIGGLASGLIPGKLSEEALYIAIAIIGATVMPHNLYLHSALVQTRQFTRDKKGILEALKFNTFDSVIALNLALFVNAGILIVAAAAFHGNGFTGVKEIQDAHQLLAPVLGTSLAPILFAVALIASGQSSTVTGTLAGQVVMEGYLGLRLRPWIRRIITRAIAIIPAVIVIVISGEGSVGKLLVFSQVLLSLQLGFAVIPLIQSVSDKVTMGEFVLKPLYRVLAWVSATVIVALNLRLVYGEIAGWMETSSQPWIVAVTTIPVTVFLIGILGYLVTEPIRKRRNNKMVVSPHSPIPIEFDLQQRISIQRVAVAVDFSDVDEIALKSVVTLAEPGSVVVLLHAVETAGAHVFGGSTDDHETLEDTARLHAYARQLQQLGYNTDVKIGFGNPRKVLVELTNAADVQLLVMAAHGHRGLGDVVRGATIDAVRHRVRSSVYIAHKNIEN